MNDEFTLKKIDGSVWINGRAYPIPVEFDFTPSAFADRTTVRLAPFDSKPLLDNSNTNDFGAHLNLSFYTTGPTASIRKQRFIERLGELWGLYRYDISRHPDLTGSFGYDIRFESRSYQKFDYGQLRVRSYDTRVLLAESQDGDPRCKTLVCLGHKDGDMRGPSSGIVYGMAHIEADQTIYNLFRQKAI
ncbi:hypothetical protein CLV58_13037 [Spirosoma oryzae]|uniref:Uncharacterized protein n=1 Tax=Spirosoma oryzae TaxID=1469603 RepID=A0A2T0S421_9BACT|nr:hypothetical protein [Spirosoma oryzae]PRY28180.1 hypothetical protein CLV58_13037 [Spirosoma oryzae]